MVRASSFACHHFAYVVVATIHPDYQLWVDTDDDFIFVKGTEEAPLKLVVRAHRYTMNHFMGASDCD